MANFEHIIRGPLLINAIVILAVFLLELLSQKTTQISHQLNYGNLKLLRPENKTELLKDISDQTGKAIQKVTVKKIDLIKGTAELEVFYPDNQ